MHLNLHLIKIYYCYLSEATYGFYKQDQDTYNIFECLINGDHTGITVTESS